MTDTLSSTKRNGFTIVELLIVIAVIAILATIATVVYNGVRVRASTSALVSDVRNAAVQSEYYKSANSSYPSNGSQPNNGTGFKITNGTTYAYSPVGSTGYCFTGYRDDLTVSYYISDTTPTPTLGACSGHPSAVSVQQMSKVTVSTLAGSQTSGYVNGQGTAARFNWVFDTATDSTGNIYVAEFFNSTIRKITPSGAVTTFAGTGSAGYADGPGATAQFNYPQGVAVDASGNVYVGDTGNNRIRKITPAGVVSTLAGDGTLGYAEGTGTGAKFNNPMQLAVDGAGNLYLNDTSNYRIRKITPAGVTSTYAGSGSRGYVDGSAGSAQFAGGGALVFDGSGNLYMTDNNMIRKISSSGNVTTLAGSPTNGYVDGNGTNARFDGAFGIAIDSSGVLFVTDSNNARIRRVTMAGDVTTYAGSGSQGLVDGPALSAKFSPPRSISIDQSNNMYVGDTYNNAIRKITSN